MLSTSANAGIPAGLKRPTLDEITSMLANGTLSTDWAYRTPPKALDAVPEKHAAGIVFVSPEGDILLIKRSGKEANYAGHWALPGGGVNPTETPLQGAKREAIEEINVDAAGGAMKLLDRRMTPTGGAFHTFACPAADKFEPKLNDEHSDHTWARLDDLPEPMHPAVMATLRERVGKANDFSDWDDVHGAFAQWVREEDDEPDAIKWNQDFKVNDLAATDSALAIAMDRESVRSFDRDGRMKVSITNLSKATVNPYRGHEIPGWQALGLDPNRVYQLLRDPEEMAKGASTFNGIQLLRKHKPVSAKDDQRWDVVGTTGTDARFENPYLQNSLHVWSQEGVDLIQSEEQCELSCGYHYRPDMTPGIFDGMRYDGVMRDIVGNHVALVEDGRAGPDVVVGDSNEEIMSTENRKAAETIHAIAKRTVSVAALNAYLAPRMAMDSKKFVMAKIFDGVTGKNFKAQKPEIAKRIVAAIAAAPKSAKLAQDATLDQVGQVLDMLEKHEVEEGTDASVSPEQHNAMEAAAHGASALDIPQKVGQEFAAKDDGGAGGLASFLKGKGMDEADIKTACDMFPKPATAKDASEESDEDKKKREEEEAKKKAAADAAEPDKDKDKDKEKPAMDQATVKTMVDAAVSQERARNTALNAALSKVRPIVGELSMAFDSAAEVYRHVLRMRGMPKEKVAALHVDALEPLVEMQPVAGARPQQRLALDASNDAQKDFTSCFPGAERIGIGG